MMENPLSIILREVYDMTSNFQDHVDKRIREMNERRRNFLIKKKKRI